MGCCASGDSDGKKKGIQCEFPKIGLESADDFFESAGAVLKTAEDLRSGLEDNKEDMIDIARVFRIKEGGSLSDAICAWIWAVAAQNAGDILKANISVTMNEPYVSADLGWCNWPCQEFQQALQEYIGTIVKAPGELQDLIPKVQDLVSKATDMLTNLKDDLTNSGMSMLKIPGALVTAGKNCSALKDAISKLQSLGPVVQEGAKDIAQICKEMPQHLVNAAINGKKAADKKETIPSKTLKYVGKPMFTKEEIRAQKKARKHSRKRAQKK